MTLNKQAFDDLGNAARSTAEILEDMAEAARWLVDEAARPEPSPGFRYCQNRACGAEVKLAIASGRCRRHRESFQPGRSWAAPLAVSPAWTSVTALGW